MVGSRLGSRVSSFGTSGTNAHVILERAPVVEVLCQVASPTAASAVPWVLSARSEQALAGQAQRLLAFVAAADLDPIDGVVVEVERGRCSEHQAVVVG